MGRLLVFLGRLEKLEISNFTLTCLGPTGFVPDGGGEDEIIAER